MAKQLPLYPIRSGPGVSEKRIQASSPPRAPRPALDRARIIPAQTSTYGADNLQRSLEGLAGVMSTIVDRENKEREEKNEIARKSAVIRHSMGIKNQIHEAAEPYFNLQGSDAVGSPKEFLKLYEDLKYKTIPEDADEKSAVDLQAQFNANFSQTLYNLRTHEDTQLNQAVEDGNQAILMEATSEALLIPFDENFLSNIDSIAERGVDKWSWMAVEEGKEIPEERRNIVKEKIKQDALTAAMVNLLVEDPKTARDFWIAKKEFFKKTMPEKYEIVNAKMEAATDRAIKEGGMKSVLAANNQDVFSASRESITPEGVEKYFDGRLSLALEASNTFYTAGAREESMKAQVKKDNLDAALKSIYLKNVDEEGNIDYGGMIKELSKLVTKGFLDASEAIMLEARWSTLEWSAEDTEAVYQKMHEMAENDIEITDADIIKMTGKGSPRPTFVAYRNALSENAALVKGGVNHYNNIKDIFTRRVNAITENAGQRARLMLELEPLLAYMRGYKAHNKYTVYHPEMYEESMKQMERVVRTDKGDLRPAETRREQRTAEFRFQADPTLWSTSPETATGGRPKTLSKAEIDALPPDVKVRVDILINEKGAKNITPEMIEAIEKYLGKNAGVTP